MKYIVDWVIYNPTKKQKEDNKDKQEHQPGVPFN